MYLSGIHAGIQTAHSVADMSISYKNNPVYVQWAEFDKTIIVLNAGMSCNLKEIIDILDNMDCVWDYFRESQEALEEAHTNVSVILPERIFNFVRNEPKEYHRRWYNCWMKSRSPKHTEYISRFSESEIKLARIIASCRLMN